MKPTYQIGQNARWIESQRPRGTAFTKAPVTDWSFQSGADLRAGTATSSPAVKYEAACPRGLYAVTQGLYEAQTKWEDRIEGFGLCVVIALATWPIMQLIYVAAHTV